MTTTSQPPLPAATSRRGPVPPALDSRKLHELAALRPSVRTRVVRAYRRDVPAVMRTIEAALERNDAVGVREGAHRLKSSSAAIGASRLAELYGELEAIARLGVLSGAREVVVALGEELPRVLSGLSGFGDG